MTEKSGGTLIVTLCAKLEFYFFKKISVFEQCVFLVFLKNLDLYH